MSGPQQRRIISTLHAPDARFLIVEARYYEDIADLLLTGAKRALDQAEAAYDVYTVPGALEIPQAVALLFERADPSYAPYDGVVALGCVVRGETYHFEIVAMQSARALMDFALDLALPTGNGVLTVETLAQAVERADPDKGDKGGEAARAALTLHRLNVGDDLAVGEN